MISRFFHRQIKIFIFFKFIDVTKAISKLGIQMWEVASYFSQISSARMHGGSHSFTEKFLPLYFLHRTFSIDGSRLHFTRYSRVTINKFRQSYQLISNYTTSFFSKPSILIDEYVTAHYLNIYGSEHYNFVM